MKKREIRAALKQLDTIPLPDKEKILSACPNRPITAETPYWQASHRKLWLKPVLAAIIVALVLASGYSTYAIANEISEYNDAVKFFKEYNLSTEDLSRSDIKKVYRDIITGSFTYGKTAEVFKKSISGYELHQDEPTPEDLEILWAYIKDGRFFVNEPPKDKDGVSYKYYEKYNYDSDNDNDVFDRSTLEKYINDKLAWSVDFTDFCIQGYVRFGEKVIVYGSDSILGTGQISHAYLAMIDEGGQVLWKSRFVHGFSNEYIAAVLPGDEEISVFSRGDLRFMCLTRLDLSGNQIFFNKTDIGNSGVWNAARLGDGYIVQLGSHMAGQYASIVKVNSDGTIAGAFDYTSDDECYYIRDMIEYNGKIYLSGYSVPVQKANKDHYIGMRYEIADILNYVFDNMYLKIPNEELTRLVRDNYTAVLLICSPESGQPDTFYTVKGSLGGRLAKSAAGKLLWDVESITDTFFSPATSSFTIGGFSYIYRYTFDDNGNLISQEKTNEIADFRR